MLPLNVQPVLKNKTKQQQQQQQQLTRGGKGLRFPSDPKPFNVFEKAIGLNKLISHIAAKTNLYASQNVCIFFSLTVLK